MALWRFVQLPLGIEGQKELLTSVSWKEHQQRERLHLARSCSVSCGLCVSCDVEERTFLQGTFTGLSACACSSEHVLEPSLLQCLFVLTKVGKHFFSLICSKTWSSLECISFLRLFYLLYAHGSVPMKPLDALKQIDDCETTSGCQELNPAL